MIGFSCLPCESQPLIRKINTHLLLLKGRSIVAPLNPGVRIPGTVVISRRVFAIHAEHLLAQCGGVIVVVAVVGGRRGGESGRVGCRSRTGFLLLRNDVCGRICIIIV